MPINGLTLAVDESHGRLEGLVLAEVDLGEHADPVPEPPIPYPAEVTDDERFTGGRRARTDSDAPTRLLSEFA